MACCICIKYSTYTFQTNSSLLQLYAEISGYTTGMSLALGILTCASYNPAGDSHFAEKDFFLGEFDEFGGENLHSLGVVYPVKV